MRFYKPAEMASIVWNPAENKALAEFKREKDQFVFDTDDHRVIDTLTNMGYPSDADAQVKSYDAMSIQDLRAMAKEREVKFTPSTKKRELVSALLDKDEERQ